MVLQVTMRTCKVRPSDPLKAFVDIDSKKACFPSRVHKVFWATIDYKYHVIYIAYCNKMVLAHKTSMID